MQGIRHRERLLVHRRAATRNPFLFSMVKETKRVLMPRLPILQIKKGDKDRPPNLGIKGLRRHCTVECVPEREIGPDVDPRAKGHVQHAFTIGPRAFGYIGC